MRFLILWLGVLLTADGAVDVEDVGQMREFENFDDYYSEPNPMNMDIPEDETLLPDDDDLDSLPDCQRQCNSALQSAIKVAMQAGNHYERYVGVCRHYNESIRCHEKLQDCSGQDMFSVMTSGLHYMCVDQKRAFDKVIECLDVQSGRVQVECEKQCRGRNRLANWAAQSGLMDVLGRSAPVPRFDGDQMRVVMQDVCDLAQCYLTCVRTNYNQHCGNSAGTLLSEAIVRPMAEGQKEPMVSAMATFMNLFMPRQCAFMINGNELAAHRIDPALDEALRRADDAAESSGRAMDEGSGEEPLEARPRAWDSGPMMGDGGANHPMFGDFGGSAPRLSFPSDMPSRSEGPGGFENGFPNGQWTEGRRPDDRHVITREESKQKSMESPAQEQIEEKMESPAQDQSDMETTEEPWRPQPQECVPFPWVGIHCDDK